MAFMARPYCCRCAAWYMQQLGSPQPAAAGAPVAARRNSSPSCSAALLAGPQGPQLPHCWLDLITAFLPSWIAWRPSSPGSARRTAVCTRRGGSRRRCGSRGACATRPYAAPPAACLPSPQPPCRRGASPRGGTRPRRRAAAPAPRAPSAWRACSGGSGCPPPGPGAQTRPPCSPASPAWKGGKARRDLHA